MSKYTEKLGKVELFDSESVIKIRILEVTWDEMLKKKEILFDAVSTELLEKVNLYYYITMNESTKTKEDTVKYVERLNKMGILDKGISDIYRLIGWDTINIQNTVFQGDIAEYLMSILVDNFLDASTIISKLSFKTTPGMAVFGNDNYFYDVSRKVLFFGESKFYKSTSKAILSAIDSLQDHSSIREVGFVTNHTSAIKANDGSEREVIIETLEYTTSEEISFKHISFIVADDEYDKDKLESVFKDQILKRGKTIDELEGEVIFVFLPILDKLEFLQYFEKELNNNAK